LGLVCASSEIAYGLDGTLLKSDRESCFNALNNYLELPQDKKNNSVSESLELVIIDSQIADSQTLIDRLSGAAEVIILDEQTDGLQQITNALSQYEDVKEDFKAIHLVSHGDVGQLFLGNTQLNTNNLSQYTELLATWNDFLTEDADIVLYGCELGATDEGIAFLEKFSQLTNTDILASNDTTGSSLLNGDWDLEVAVGNIETKVIFNSNIAETYNHTLVGTTFGELRLIDNANLVLESGALNPNTFNIGDLGISFTNLKDLDDLIETASFAGIKDGYLQFELLDINGDFVIIETDFTDVDYSFVDNPYNFSFDGDFYLANYPDVADLGQNPFLHYMQTGWKQGKNPSAFFGTKYYLDNNVDVRNSGQNPLEHFYTLGWKQGKDPSQFFDTTFYLDHNPGVKIDGINPVEHYNTSGWKELRDPSPYFDTEFYLRENPAVLEKQINPLDHYITTGWKQGKNPNQFFNTEFYLASHPDVAGAKTNPLGQYINTGWKEGRNPSPFFEGKYYLNKYVDVAKSGLGPLEHFNISGLNEGRSPNKVFGTAKDAESFLVAPFDPNVSLSNYDFQLFKETALSVVPNPNNNTKVAAIPVIIPLIPIIKGGATAIGITLILKETLERVNTIRQLLEQNPDNIFWTPIDERIFDRFESFPGGNSGNISPDTPPFDVGTVEDFDNITFFPTENNLFANTVEGILEFPLEVSEGVYVLFIESNETINKLINSSSPGQVTKGRTRQYETSGGYNKANEIFDSLNLSNVRNISDGRVGQLDDGRTVIVRGGSTDGRPTLEIQQGKNRLKFRFNN
jgi:hypothetical protein